MTHNQFIGRIVLGVAAMALWFVFFCGGLLVETVEYRAYLAPHSFPKHAETDKEAGIIVEPYTGSSAYAFVAAALWFTPTNLAFLAILGGLLGGCGSNILVERLSQEEVDRIDPNRMKYLVESPWAAMMRSFIVYLCVIAGLYFAIDDPFKNSTPAQYMRLAGTISVLALLVGYDPTRIRAWIGLVPSPPAPKLTVTESNVKMETKQVSVTASSSDAAPLPPKTAPLGEEVLQGVNADVGLSNTRKAK